MYVDCNSFGPHAIEAAVRLYGAERIVCGTDGTEFGCDWTKKAVAEAQIGEEAREQILHHNAGAMLARIAGAAHGQRAAPPNKLRPSGRGRVAHDLTLAPGRRLVLVALPIPQDWISSKINSINQLGL